MDLYDYDYVYEETKPSGESTLENKPDKNDKPDNQSIYDKEKPKVRMTYRAAMSFNAIEKSLRLHKIRANKVRISKIRQRLRKYKYA